MVCLSFGNEIDTHAFIQRMREEGRQIYVPRAVPGSLELTVHPWPCPTEKLRFGLIQPSADAPALAPPQIEDVLNVAVLVGVGFDERAYRLGYGAGYFDRFLQRKRFPSIGLAYEVQMVPALPVEPHDVQLAVVVTEARVVRPPPSS